MPRVDFTFESEKLSGRGIAIVTTPRSVIMVSALSVKPKGLDRPWSPTIPDQGESEKMLTAKPAARRSQDATPIETDLQATDLQADD